MMRRPPLFVILVISMIIPACDTVAPVDESHLVVEGFLSSGRPLPPIQVGRTISPYQAYDSDAAAVADATVELVLDGNVVRYVPDSTRRGVYRPSVAGVIPSAGQQYSFQAAWKGNVAGASGMVPPEIEIVDVALTMPAAPVSAVLLDSLALTDSISTGLYTGFIYPIEVTIKWLEANDEEWKTAESWMRAQLKPYATFSSPVVDLFLRSDEIFRENEQALSSGKRTWTGIYAVGVAESDDPLPEHSLRVSLLRSGPEYARFAASRDAPDRREPLTNLTGAAGIFAAVAVDSTQLSVMSDAPSSNLRRTSDSPSTYPDDG